MFGGGAEHQFHKNNKKKLRNQIKKEEINLI